MKKIVTTLLFMLSLFGQAQITQNIRGLVIDKDSKSPLPGANIVITSVTPLQGAATDFDGRFKVVDVPIGRHNIKISYVGYEPKTLTNIELTSGKELILNIEIQESIIMNEVVVKSGPEKDKTINKMATVSARTFSIEETQRYAGSLNDVARMAQNFAGVQGADDSRNDIVIRGNSPTGVLYRLEDVDIPNPNHFALNGTTGGPISILNNNVLDNSDFMTGAFPAEYGNALAGVFDLKLKNGNNEKHEFLSQIGFNGLEFTAEGPINKESYSSYIASYRYSTLGLFKKMGLNFGAGTAVPGYQDAMFKLNFPNKKGRTVLWGVGGVSEASFLDSEQEGEENLFTDSGEDIVFKSRIGVISISNTYRFNDKAFLKTSFAVDVAANDIINDTLNPTNGSYNPYYRNNSYEGKQSINVVFNQKINARNLLKIGVYNQRKFFHLKDSIHQRSDSVLNPFTNSYVALQPQWKKLTNYDGATYFIQPFMQWQFRVNEDLTLNTGIHSQYFVYNSTFAVEPRLGIKYKSNDKSTVSAGYGLHNQLAPTRLFFREQTDLFGNTVFDDKGEAIIPNKELKMVRSQHFVVAYDRNLGKHSRLKMEAYYQLLDNVPVSYRYPQYSTLNFGANFDLAFPDTLVNKGTGTNYGLEFTVERFLHNGFYYLFTGSIYNSTYKGVDGIERNTAFNGNYTTNVLVGKEFYFTSKKPSKKQSSLLLDIKFTLNGGQRYIPIDLEQSQNQNVAVYDYDNAFAPQHPEYFRTDIKIGYKLNGKKITQEWAFTMQNATNRKNVFSQGYDASTQSVFTRYQIGKLPIMQYKILF